MKTNKDTPKSGLNDKSSSSSILLMIVTLRLFNLLSKPVKNSYGACGIRFEVEP